ncbi:MAG TPA: transglycosylase SLT domain-containing protein [Streptosporangiaceae bacterium]|nr:transglycosylase SLT domain-containing protein [Streptosporangiaceae bacterium]
MTGFRRLLSLTASLAATGLVVGCSNGAAPGQGNAGPSPTASAVAASPSASSHPSSAHRRPKPIKKVPRIGGNPARLAAQLTAAEKALSRGSGSANTFTRQALILQLVCLKLAYQPSWAGSVLSRVPSAWRSAASADITSTADLVAITPGESKLPPWKLIRAKSKPKLLSYYHAAQKATGVNWSYLAAINFIETDFGRIKGPSSTGAQGPMQFEPATWASYGHGSIYNPRDAIMAAARYLRASGAPGDMSRAIFAYNNSSNYVRSVQRFAARMRASKGALTSYYHHQIIYHLASGWVWLPPGWGTSHRIRAISTHI